MSAATKALNAMRGWTKNCSPAVRSDFVPHTYFDWGRLVVKVDGAIQRLNVTVLTVESCWRDDGPAVAFVFGREVACHWSALADAVRCFPMADRTLEDGDGFLGFVLTEDDAADMLPKLLDLLCVKDI